MLRVVMLRAGWPEELLVAQIHVDGDPGLRMWLPEPHLLLISLYFYFSFVSFLFFIFIF